MKSTRSRTASSTPDVGQGVRGVGGHPAYLLRQAAAAVRSALDERFGEFGITHPQFVVLIALKSCPGASGAELARLSLLTPQTITVITRNLERATLIRRGAGSDQGRRVPYELTRKGLETLAACNRVADDVEQTMQQELSPQEALVVKKWLVHVAKSLFTPEEQHGET
ncbi:MAG: MarR family winged helix-turn-helix transcriptional regulator [Planctomycetota bacterium]